MKATCIVGSARSNGSTAYLIDTLIKGMSEAGIESKKQLSGFPPKKQIDKDLYSNCSKCLSLISDLPARFSYISLN